MSCLLHHPSRNTGGGNSTAGVPSPYYSKSSSLTTTSSITSSALIPPTSTTAVGLTEFVRNMDTHQSTTHQYHHISSNGDEDELHDPVHSATTLLNSASLHDRQSFTQHRSKYNRHFDNDDDTGPDVGNFDSYISTDETGSPDPELGESVEGKAEGFFPQPNSPVEFSKNDSYFFQNGFHNQYRQPFTSQSESHRHIASSFRNHELFGLNLKQELENYLLLQSCHGNGADQFRKFRGNPLSPASSLSCSSSSLLSLAPSTTGLGSPTRRHSFSSTLPNAQAMVGSLMSTYMTNINAFSANLAGCGTTTTSSSVGYYRQRSHTYSSSTTKPHPYPMTKRTLGAWNSSALSSQSDLRDHIEALRIRPSSSMSDEFREQQESKDDDELKAGRSDSSDSSRKGSVDGSKDLDNSGSLFLGPFGKKRRMVRERQRSLESVEMLPVGVGESASPLEVVGSSPLIALQTSDETEQHRCGSVPKEKVEDIVEEDEDNIEVCQDEPLNLCIAIESESGLESVRKLDTSFPSVTGIGGSGFSLPEPPMPPPSQSSGNVLGAAEGSVLRNQLLGLNLGPTPPQYQTRERSASMSVITLRERMSVIQETRAAIIGPRLAYSPPAANQQQPTPLRLMPTRSDYESHMNSTLSLRSGASSESSSSSRRALQCHECGKVFSQLRNYRYHRSRHEGTTQFSCVCPVCHKQFNDKGYLSSHLKIHRNEKEYKCSFCSKRFNQRVAYNMHVRIHTGVKPHVCTTCGKAFSRKMLLRQHNRTHTGERPYSCDQCGKSFADRSNMLLHQRLHSGIRPFECDVCGKTFSKNHHLKTHLNHHAGIKPYECPKCKTRFSQSSNMKTHFRKCSAVPSENLPPVGPFPPEIDGERSSTSLQNPVENRAYRGQPSHYSSLPVPNGYEFEFEEGAHQPHVSPYPLHAIGDSNQSFAVQTEFAADSSSSLRRMTSPSRLQSPFSPTRTYPCIDNNCQYTQNGQHFHSRNQTYTSIPGSSGLSPSVIRYGGEGNLGLNSYTGIPPAVGPIDSALYPPPTVQLARSPERQHQAETPTSRYQLISSPQHQHMEASSQFPSHSSPQHHLSPSQQQRVSPQRHFSPQQQLQSQSYEANARGRANTWTATNSPRRGGKRRQPPL